MKTTNSFSKKLQFNKETIAKLNNEEMIGIEGGATLTIRNCKTFLTVCKSCVMSNCNCFTAQRDKSLCNPQSCWCEIDYK